MLRTLFSFWRYYKERLLITLVGLLIVSSGLGFLTGLSESSKGTVVSTLQNKWEVSYHILVRPVGTTITDPQNQLLEPNIQSGIANGITMDQWEQIKQISDIEIAAPLAIVGYRPLIFRLNEEAKLDEYGIYRVHYKVTADNGIQQQLVSSENHYIAYGPWEGNDAFTEYGVSVSGLNDPKAQFAEDNVLLVGIDPSEENKLVGFDQALVSLPQGQSRYFNSTDSSKMEQEDHYKAIHLPILLSNGSLAKKTYTYTYEKLNLPFNDNQKAVSTMQKIKDMGGKDYLDDVSTSSQMMHSYTSDQLLPQMISSLFDAKLQLQPARTFQKPMPLLYNAVTTPYKDRWGNAYELKSYTTNDEMVQQSFPEFYRSYETHVDSDTKAASNQFMLIPDYIGMYDSSKLQIKSDIDNQFPMDTYNSPAAKAVLDSKGRPINPPVTIRSINNPLGFMSNPPMMLTTIDAASKIIGEQPISVIRVKVTGIDKVSDQNYEKVEKIASEIREKTGLLTDITFASAPEPVIIHVPTSKTQTKLGWIEEYWIKLGTSITLLNEVTAGFSGMLVLILLVALIYVFVSNTISFLVRKKEIAILLCLGWRTGQIRRMLLLEAIILGLFASLVTWSIQGYFIFFQEREVSIVKFLWIGFSGMFIYIIGAVAPLVMVNKIRPIAAIHSGENSEVSRRLIPVQGLFGLALAYFNGRLKRNLLSVLSMTLPTVLLTFFIFCNLTPQRNFLFILVWTVCRCKGRGCSLYYGRNNHIHSYYNYIRNYMAECFRAKRRNINTKSVRLEES